jgi:hypothetical protein
VIIDFYYFYRGDKTSGYLEIRPIAVIDIN